MKPTEILLTTLNARYIHSAFGLRYLYANMGELQARTRIEEFTIKQRPIDIAEQIIAAQPRIVGIGCYIWNIREVAELCAILKQLDPNLVIVLGGPEISYESEQSPAFAYADFIVRGQADLAFAQLCRNILSGLNTTERIIDSPVPAPTDLELPYTFYNNEDIRQRVIYVEASRGCPFKCEFCLSALDKSAQAFDIDGFLEAMEDLYRRGARHFKFVDRTFNLKQAVCERILRFFLDKPLDDLLLHFELIPDRLPDALKSLIEAFPPGCLQFEIGIQTFNPQVQQLISRRQDHEKTLSNLRYLNSETGVHLHADLIAGLPGEDIDSFARGFDLLVSLGGQEIQLGILKRLRGTPIDRHRQTHGMVYNPLAPYEVLSTDAMDAPTLFRIKRFARYWDLIANSGRFANWLPLLLGDSPFHRFLALSDWLHAKTGQTHRIALPRLFRLLYEYRNNEAEVKALKTDFARSGIKGLFEVQIGSPDFQPKTVQSPASRQQRHLH